MSAERSLEQLPADQQAVISLLVRQGRTYEQVAFVLRIDADALRSRAHQALLTLAGAPSSELSGDDVGEIGDYVLGQQGDAERIETLALLLDSAAARAWGRAAAAGIATVATVALPAVPDEVDTPVEAEAPYEEAPYEEAPYEAERPYETPAPVEARAVAEHDSIAEAAPAASSAAEIQDGPADSVLGRWLVLISALAVIAAVVVFVSRSGGSSSPAVGPIPASAATSTTPAAGTSTGATSATGTSTGTSTTPSSNQILLRIPLRATRGAGKAAGQAAIVQTSTGRIIAFQAANLPAPQGAHYVLWLYQSPTHFKALGLVPTTTGGSVGPLSVPLPSDASLYHGVLLTLETSGAPKSPHAAVLLGSSTSPL